MVSKNAAQVPDLDEAREKVLLDAAETFAAPNLLYLKNAPGTKRTNVGGYSLATEIYPHRYTDNPEGEWQVKAFAATSPDGDLHPVAGDLVLHGQRAGLFQHVFNGHFYGFDCHFETADQN